jgi:hypothetical protein
MASFLFRVLGELTGDLRAAEASRGNGMAGITHPAHDLSSENLVEDRDDFLGILAVRVGDRSLFHLLPGTLADRGDVGAETLCWHDGVSQPNR